MTEHELNIEIRKAQLRQMQAEFDGMAERRRMFKRAMLAVQIAIFIALSWLAIAVYFG